MKRLFTVIFLCLMITGQSKPDMPSDIVNGATIIGAATLGGAPFVGALLAKELGIKNIAHCLLIIGALNTTLGPSAALANYFSKKNYHTAEEDKSIFATKAFVLPFTTTAVISGLISLLIIASVDR